MEIIVCIKPVLDPDLPTAKFAVDGKNNKVVQPEGMPLVVSPYDLLAVEAAVRIKESKGGKITVITMGTQNAEDAIRKALAMGADDGIILDDKTFECSDGFGTAHALSQAVKKIGPFDLVLCGRQAADWDNGMVGSVIAEYLGIPMVTRAKMLEVTDKGLKVERMVMNGTETYECGLPALVSLSNELGQARIPSGWGIITAAKKQITRWNSADIGADVTKTGRAAIRNKLIKLYVPEYQRKCELVTGKGPEEIVSQLAEKILAMRP